MEPWKRRLTVLAAALGAVWMLMSTAEARERDRDDGPTIPSISFTLPSFPTTTPPPTMPPPATSTTTPPPTMPPPNSSTTTPPPTMPPTSLPPPSLPPDVEDLIEDVISELEEFGDEFQDIIDFLSNPFGGF